MEFIKRNSDYAFRSLAYMAKSSQNRVFLLSQIAKKTKISEEFLRKLFQRLAQKGILLSRRGSKGGFILAKDLSRITLLEVMEALQGPVVLNQCQTEIFCSNQSHCVLRKGMQKMQKKLVSLFAKTSIMDLM